LAFLFFTIFISSYQNSLQLYLYIRVARKYIWYNEITMENKNYEYIEKPKIAEKIDPLLAREYEKLAADKARSLINRPSHEVSLVPEHDLVPLSHPDRDAETKSREAWSSYQKVKSHLGDEIDSFRAVKEEIKKQNYSKDAEKNPDTFYGAQMSGTTEGFIGDGDHAVIQSSDFDDIKDLEKKAIDEAESKDYINGLPEGKLVEPIDLNKFREQLRFRKNDNNGNTDGPGAA